MQLFKKWCFQAVAMVLLTLASVYGGSFTGYPLAAVLWADFAAWTLINLGGVYALTRSGGNHREAFSWLMGVARLTDGIPLRWYHRVFIAVLMWSAGWHLSALAGLTAVFQRLMLAPELERATA